MTFGRRRSGVRAVTLGLVPGAAVTPRLGVCAERPVEMRMNIELFDAMRRSIVDGDPDAAAALAERAVTEGVDPLEAIDEGFVVGLRRVGEGFGCGELFLPDLMLAARAMQRATAVLEPELARRASSRTSAGRVVLGTVLGDIHEIGKNLVATMLTANGFEVRDLGVNVAPERFAEAARDFDATIVGVSALLTTTMANQRSVVEALEAAGLRPAVKVIVGGAPVTEQWATEIGADGYGEDAVAAVNVARRLVTADEPTLSAQPS